MIGFYTPWDNDEVTVKMELPKESETSLPWSVKVYHQWIKYTGLFVTYDFCKTCDVKKDDTNSNGFCK